MRIGFVSALLSFSLASGAASATTVELISNGGFEVDDIPANTQAGPSPTVTGWTGIAWLVDGAFGAPVWPTGGSSGDQFADFGNRSELVGAQDFTVPAGHEISSISWFANTTKTVASSPYTVELLDGLGGTLVAENFSVVGLDVWTPTLLDLGAGSLGPGDYTFQLYGTAGLGGADVIIDDVSVLATAIPVPAALWLFGSSVVALKATRRRVPRRASR